MKSSEFIVGYNETHVERKKWNDNKENKE